MVEVHLVEMVEMGVEVEEMMYLGIMGDLVVEVDLTQMESMEV